MHREKSKFNLFDGYACADEDRASVRSACGRCRIGKVSHWHVNFFYVYLVPILVFTMRFKAHRALITRNFLEGKGLDKECDSGWVRRS